MTQIHRAVLATWCCSREILQDCIDLHEDYQRSGCNSGACAAEKLPSVLTSIWGGCEKRQCSVLFVPVFLHFQDSAKYFSTSKAHIYQFYLDIHVVTFIKSTAVTETAPELEAQWWRTQTWDLSSEVHVLVCSKEIKPQRMTTNIECYKEKVDSSREAQGEVRAPPSRGDSW